MGAVICWKIRPKVLPLNLGYFDCIWVKVSDLTVFGRVERRILIVLVKLFPYSMIYLGEIAFRIGVQLVL